VPRPTDRPLQDRPADIVKLVRGRDFRRALQAAAALRHLEPASAAHLVDSIKRRSRASGADPAVMTDREVRRAQRVLVVGGTRGTGLLIAQALAGRGHRVRVLARDPAAALRRLGSVVEIVRGDVTKADTLGPATREVDAIVYTAGVRSGRLASERQIKETDYDGVVNTLSAARLARADGRFVYMTSIGGGVAPSLPATLLNLVKGNVLAWRRRAEDKIRASGLDYTIVRAGFLVNGPGGRRALTISQGNLPLAFRHRVARADVAEVCVAALGHPRASRASFELVWGPGARRESVDDLLDALGPD
jgi:nucleoside-diphosphate-sugar epimerase